MRSSAKPNAGAGIEKPPPESMLCAKSFISYSHQDEAWKDHLLSHLNVLAGEGLEVWDDRRIAAGDDWLPEIERAIAACDVAVLLISRHFLTFKIHCRSGSAAFAAIAARRRGFGSSR